MTKKKTRKIGFSYAYKNTPITSSSITSPIFSLRVFDEREKEFFKKFWETYRDAKPPQKYKTKDHYQKEQFKINLEKEFSEELSKIKWICLDDLFTQAWYCSERWNERYFTYKILIEEYTKIPKMNKTINLDSYKNNIKIVDKVSHAEYRVEENRLKWVFKNHLETHFKLENLKVKTREMLFRIAWDKGHSSGYSEVYIEYDALVDLLNTELKP